MSELRYLQDYDSRLGLYRWQIAPGERLLPRAGRDLRVVALGGGTGLAILLKGLKGLLFPHGEWAPARDRDRLTAIVTVADDGGSSGRLRQTYGVPAPGDIRNCLLALSDGDPTIEAIFNFRFKGDGDVGGHSLGNLILTALSQLETDFSTAVARGGEMLGAFKRQLDTEGSARLRDGRVVNFHEKVAGGWRYLVAHDAPFGLGAPGYKLIPYRTVAVDPRRIKLGSVLYVPALVGIRLPSGDAHDGFVFAHDIGQGIIGNRIDLFVGFEDDSDNALTGVMASPLSLYRVDAGTAARLGERFKGQFERQR